MILGPYCYSECPPKFFQTNITTTVNGSALNVATCDRCHFTCSRCFGALSNQCLQCPFHYRWTSSNECVDMDDFVFRPTLKLVLYIVIPIASVIAIGLLVFFVFWLRRLKESKGDDNTNLNSSPDEARLLEANCYSETESEDEIESRVLPY